MAEEVCGKALGLPKRRQARLRTAGRVADNVDFTVAGAAFASLRIPEFA